MSTAFYVQQARISLDFRGKLMFYQALLCFASCILRITTHKSLVDDSAFWLSETASSEEKEALSNNKDPQIWWKRLVLNWLRLLVCMFLSNWLLQFVRTEIYLYLGHYSVRTACVTVNNKCHINLYYHLSVIWEVCVTRLELSFLRGPVGMNKRGEYLLLAEVKKQRAWGKKVIRSIQPCIVEVVTLTDASELRLHVEVCCSSLQESWLMKNRP